MEDVSIWYGIAIVLNVLSALGFGYLVVERYVFKIDTIQPEETFESEEEKKAVVDEDNRGALITFLVIMGITGLIAAYVGPGPFAAGLGSVISLDVAFALLAAVFAYVVMKAKKTSLSVMIRNAFSSRSDRS